MKPNFLNVHILSSLAFANPNRDDSGAPKTAVYGGVDRSRMSSQSLKRAARLGFQERTQSASVRSAQAADLVTDRMAANGVRIDGDTWSYVDRAVRSLVEDGPKARKRSDDEEAVEGEEVNDKKDTLAWFSAAELDRLAVVLQQRIANDAKWNAKAVKEIRAEVAEAVTSPSMEIAAFGRMFAASPSSATDAAIQVAHAVSTHEHWLQVDYFTAVDDLRQHGAGHIGFAMFAGAVYYRHFCLDRAQLQANLGDEFVQLGSQVSALIESMLVELPRGKVNSTAHQSLPSLVVAIPGSRPANCAEAFECPIKTDKNAGDTGYVVPSAAALGRYVAEMASFVPGVFEGGWMGGRAEAVQAFADGYGEASSASLPGLVDAMAGWTSEPAR